MKSKVNNYCPIAISEDESYESFINKLNKFAEENRRIAFFKGHSDNTAISKLHIVY